MFSAPLFEGLNLEHRRVAVANLKHETGQSLSNIITGHVVQIVATAVVAEDDVPMIGNNLPIAKHVVRGQMSTGQYPHSNSNCNDSFCNAEVRIERKQLI